MKKNICFAGFSAEELETLTQAMSGMSGAWEGTFVPDGEAALEAMKEKTFDAVLGNMQMPGMNGAQLLQQVGALQPTALRFIIGDLADQELVINVIGGTHQFISRPYKAQEIVSVIQRSFALDACLSNEQLRSIVPKLGRLPTLPSTYFEVLKRVESRDASAESVAEVVVRDPAATARVLQMVNSAAYSLSQKVTDPAHAVVLLGLDTVKSLVLCLQVFNKVERAKQEGFSLEQLWEHSTKVAKLARALTLQETGDPRQGNDAFTAGLLHDMGRIILASNLAKEYAAVVAGARQKRCALHEEELAQLGVTHAQVGAYLLGLWGMPAALVEAAGLHHTPDQSSCKEFSLLTAVHVADVLAHENDSPEIGLALPQLDMPYLEKLRLVQKVAAWRKAAVASYETERVKRSGAAASKTPQPVAAAQAEPVSQTKSNAAPAPAEPKPQPRPVPTPAAAPQRTHVASPRRFADLQPKYAIPAGVALVIIIAVAWGLQGSGSKKPIQVQAKKAELPSTATSTPAKPASADSEEADIASRQPANPKTPSPLSNAQPIAANGSTSASAVQTPHDVFDGIKVQGIFYGAAHRSVILNGRLLLPGEHFGKIQVVSIGPSSVLLSCDGVQKTLRIK